MPSSTRSPQASSDASSERGKSTQASETPWSTYSMKRLTDRTPSASVTGPCPGTKSQSAPVMPRSLSSAAIQAFAGPAHITGAIPMKRRSPVKATRLSGNKSTESLFECIGPKCWKVTGSMLPSTLTSVPVSRKRENSGSRSASKPGRLNLAMKLWKRAQPNNFSKAPSNTEGVAANNAAGPTSCAASQIKLPMFTVTNKAGTTAF
mmetsp:Transcript_57430/g.146067  ORF Transcript_57430/g.146067 Transcript_57430/m.146067 type:complete len:206 (+) Transcript_57430:1-618(+)